MAEIVNKNELVKLAFLQVLGEVWHISLYCYINWTKQQQHVSLAKGEGGEKHISGEGEGNLI